MLSPQNGAPPNFVVSTHPFELGGPKDIKCESGSIQAIKCDILYTGLLEDAHIQLRTLLEATFRTSRSNGHLRFITSFKPLLSV